MKGVTIVLDSMKTFSIGVASMRSGLTPRMIRYMEERSWIKPLYIKIGSVRQRRYSEELVEQLAAIARYRQEGFELEAAVRLASDK